MQWICLAQDVCKGKGVSAIYDLKSGWGVGYPETSGYIIGTYLAYAGFTGDDRYLERAIQVGDWEVDIQLPNGGVLSNPLHSFPRVFNTGQVLLGWCALYERTENVKYLNAGVRSGEYLLEKQEEDGAWRKDTFCGARTYHARIDWALVRLANLTGQRRFENAAYRNIRWVLNQQRENGWFAQCGFVNSLPITHVIAYTLRGLLECYLLKSVAFNGLEILQRILKAADALCVALQRDYVRGIPGMAPTSFDAEWQSNDDHSCLTGNVQLAYFFLRLAQTTHNECYKKIADILLLATKRTQIIDTSIEPIRGAIAGSYPIYRGYSPNSFPNWAAKFFADALLMKIQYGKAIPILA